MQISTRDGGDWVIDCLVPGVREMMPELGVVFSNPEIVKVRRGYLPMYNNGADGNVGLSWSRQ